MFQLVHSGISRSNREAISLIQTHVNPYKSNHQTEPPASRAGGELKKTMDFKISLGLFRLGSICLCLVSTWFFTALLFVPFALGPLLINLS
jgi:hypothetical protein